jgi:hypothetical protein
MDFKQKEQFVRGLVFFIPGVIGLPYSLLIQDGDARIYHLILGLILSLVFLIIGSVLIVRALAGKIQKTTKYPPMSSKSIIIIISIFSVLGVTLSILFSLNLNISSGLIFLIWIWGWIGYAIWYYFNQKAMTKTEKEISN